MRVGVKGHPRWRLMVGVCFGVGDRWATWEIAGAAAAGRHKEETGMIVSFFLITSGYTRMVFFLFSDEKNVMSDRFHRDRNNVRRVG